MSRNECKLGSNFFFKRSFASFEHSAAQKSNDILFQYSWDPDINFVDVNFENLNRPNVFSKNFTRILDNSSPFQLFFKLAYED